MTFGAVLDATSIENLLSKTWFPILLVPWKYEGKSSGENFPLEPMQIAALIVSSSASFGVAVLFL